MTKIQETWWVTGASAGIGLALVERLAKAGHRVIATSRNVEELNALALIYTNLIPMAADVANNKALQLAFNSLSPQPENLHGIILSAGICEYIDLPEFNSQSIQKQMQVNFMGVVHACELALPLLQKTAATGARPQLVGIGSMSSYVGFPRAEGYGASKAAMAYFLESLRCDVQPKITVTVVYPGFVATRLTAANDFPMPFLWTSEQAADYVMSKLGKGKATIRFPWQLHWLLTIASWFPRLWYGVLVPILVRKSKF